MEVQGSSSAEDPHFMFLKNLVQKWRRASGRGSGHCVDDGVGEVVSCDGGMLQEESEPVEWRDLHVGCERGANCEKMQALLSYVLQRHWSGKRTQGMAGFQGFTVPDNTWPAWMCDRPLAWPNQRN